MLSIHLRFGFPFLLFQDTSSITIVLLPTQENQRPRRVPWKLRSSGQMTSTANLPHPSPEHASFSGLATLVVIRRGLVLLQLNAEGISKAKIQVIEHLATKNLATVILLQETHVTNPDVLNIPGYSLAAYTSSRVHVRLNGETSHPQRLRRRSNGSHLKWRESTLQMCTSPLGLAYAWVPYNDTSKCIYAGDFYCHSTTWGYSSTNTDGTTLEHWALQYRRDIVI